GGSFGWARGCDEVTHRVDDQAGRIIDTVSAAGRRRVVYGQRQRYRKLCRRQVRRHELASPPGWQSFGFSDLRRRTDLLPQRRGGVGRDCAREGIQGAREEPTRWADAGLDGGLWRLDLRPKPDPSVPSEQLDDMW